MWKWVCVFLVLFASFFASCTAKKITITLDYEPPQLNSTRAQDPISFLVLGHIMEGLTKFDKHGKITPGISERWEAYDNKLIFYLRKNALWSDGKPVTANDFVYAWRKVIEPANASPYAPIMYPIKNAEAINTKKILDLSELGVKALDDYTLQVVFEKPCPYFPTLIVLGTFLPVREDFHKLKGERYGANAEDLIFNGPFRLTKWQHGASLRFERNEQYYNQAQTNIDIIDILYVLSDKSSTFNLFKDKKIDFTRLDKETYKFAQRQDLKIIPAREGTGVYIMFNHRQSKLTSNLNLRKAIAATLDVEEYVNKVQAVPGYKVSYGLIPSYMPGIKLRFRQEFPLPKTKQDITKAKEYLDTAMKELKLTKPPTLNLLIDDDKSIDAEYFQSVLQKHLGITINIDKQIFKQRLAKTNAGEFDLAYWLWNPDYLDPMTFADLLASWNPNNQGQFVNAEVDAEIKTAQSTMYAKIRMNAMARAEKIVMDQVALIPLYERSRVYVKSDRINNIIMNPIGFYPNFTQTFLKE